MHSSYLNKKLIIKSSNYEPAESNLLLLGKSKMKGSTFKYIYFF